MTYLGLKVLFDTKLKLFPFPILSFRVSILPHGIIQFTHILEEDEGLYQCLDGSSQNNLANATLEVIVSDLDDTTEYIPLINTAPSSQEKAISESALLECLPQMEDFTVTWTWNGKFLSRWEELCFYILSSLYFISLSPFLLSPFLLSPSQF